MCGKCRSAEGFSLIGTKEGGCSCLCGNDEIEVQEGTMGSKRTGRCSKCGHMVGIPEQK